MDLSKDININLFKKKQTKLPSKKTLNLYQPDYRNDPKRILTIAGIAIALIVVVLGKVLIIDKVVELTAYKNETADMEVQYNAMMNQLNGYKELKEKYYRYSENYANDEKQLYDRIAITKMLNNVTEGLATITSTTINDNLVNITVVTADLDVLAQFRNKLQNVPYVKDVVVYSAVRDSGDVTSSVAFKCEVEEAE